MKIISQRREQAGWAYNGAVFEVKKEIPIHHNDQHTGTAVATLSQCSMHSERWKSGGTTNWV